MQDIPKTPGEEFSHYSVMKQEAIDALQIRPDGIYVDGTAGGGGHSIAIAEKLTAGGHLIALDQDADAIAAVTRRTAAYADRVTVVKTNFSEVSAVLDMLSVPQINGALFDLGVSSHQLDDAGRGFSYMQDAPLDMRMDRATAVTAADLINGAEEAALRKILWEYGEEKFAAQIARRICSEREKEPITRTLQLAELIKNAIPPKARQGGHHPAKKSFQAIRIALNKELDVIEPTLRGLIERLVPGGRLAVITFHSLEDRIVKQTYASYEGLCTCPPDFPVCVCGCRKTGRALKSLTPSEGELNENPRSRSARLRVFEKEKTE